MSGSSAERNPVEVLADDFLARQRRGERPSLDEYVTRHPELADEIRDLFPILLDMEDARHGLAGLPGPAPGSWNVPRRLGDYRILREIGRGGMGVVYEAEQEALGRRVALKTLVHTALTPQQVRRFEREARSAARLHHTNIVPIFGVGHEGETYYYVMQYIPGQPLDQVLKEVRRLRHLDRRPPGQAEAAANDRTAERPAAADVAQSLWSGRLVAAPAGRSDAGPVADPTPGGDVIPTDPAAPDTADVAVEPASSPESGSDVLSSSTDLTGSRSRYAHAVARIGVQVAEALEYAAGQGITHRDVKPSNILLDLDGTAWVTDFGLAKVAGQEDLTHSGDVLGTLRYMAPERFHGQADVRSDVYALGLTLYELLALRPAHDESDRGRLLRQVTHEDPPPLNKLEPTTPRDLATVVHKAMAREPAERYATAGALALDLRRFLEDRPIVARRPGLLDRTAKWSRRNRLLVLVTGGMLLILLAAMIVATALVWRANRALLRTLESEQYASYLQRVALAEREWAASNLRRTEELLDECPDSLRGWEWHYLRRLRCGDLPPLRHEAAVYSVAISPQGDRLAASDNTGGVTIWDARTYQRLSRFPAHKGIAWAVAFSPDGMRLASGGEGGDGGVKVWDVGSAKLVHTLGGDHAAVVHSVAFSPDGRRLVSTTGDAAIGSGEIRIWDLTTRELIRSWPDLDSSQVAFSPDSRQLASVAGDPEIQVRDIATGETHPLPGVRQPLWCVAFSPDGRWIAAGGGMHHRRDNGEVKVWDARTGREWRTLRGHIGLVTSVAFSPDGRRLASAGYDQAIKVWDVTTGQETLNLRGHRNVVSSVAFGPDGRLFSGSDDHTVLVWDGRTWHEGERGQEFLTLPGTGESVSSVTFSPNGRLLATADCAGLVKLWTPWTGREPRTVRASALELYGVAFNPDGRLLAAAGNENVGKVWEVTTGREIRRFEKASFGTAMGVAFSPDGRSLAVSGWGLDVRIFDVADGHLIRQLEGHHGAPNAVAFDPKDGRYLVSGGEDGTVRVWDVADGRELRRLEPTQEGRVSGVAFSPDGTLLASGGWDRAVHLWDTSVRDPVRWKPLRTLPDPSSSIECVTIGPGGRLVAWGGTDSTVKVWDRTTRETHVLRGHLGWVHSVAFSPDGQHIASGSQDGRVKIWPIPSSP